MYVIVSSCFLFFSKTATTEFYTLSLHDALPISGDLRLGAVPGRATAGGGARPARPPAPQASRGRAAGTFRRQGRPQEDRKSTRLNSSHSSISYAVFCLKKKKLIDDIDQVFADLF